MHWRGRSVIQTQPVSAGSAKERSRQAGLEVSVQDPTVGGQTTSRPTLKSLDRCNLIHALSEVRNSYTIFFWSSNLNPDLSFKNNPHELSCQVGGRGVQVTCSVLGAVENCSRMAGGQGSVRSVCASGAKWIGHQHSTVHSKLWM